MILEDSVSVTVAVLLLYARLIEALQQPASGAAPDLWMQRHDAEICHVPIADDPSALTHSQSI